MRELTLSEFDLVAGGDDHDSTLPDGLPPTFDINTTLPGSNNNPNDNGGFPREP